MTDTADTPLRILCIHGYMQNDRAFRERTGAFRKLIKKRAELVFITAPNVVPPLEDEDGDNAASNNNDQRGWWFSRAADDYFKALDHTDCCKGYQESLEVIQQAVGEQGPFDGILGFSQGASMVSLLCGLQEQNTPDWPIKFEFAILIAGFKSRSAPHNELYSKQISIPTLHVFGDTDKVIPKDLSEDLLQYFENPLLLRHSGGHFIPASGPQKKVYQEFLNDMLERRRQKACI